MPQRRSQLKNNHCLLNLTLDLLNVCRAFRLKDMPWLSVCLAGRLTRQVRLTLPCSSSLRGREEEEGERGKEGRGGGGRVGFQLKCSLPALMAPSLPLLITISLTLITYHSLSHSQNLYHSFPCAPPLPPPSRQQVKFPGMESGPIAPYFKLFHVHHTIGGDAQRFYAEVAENPDFNVCREAIDYLVEQICTVEQKLAEFQTLGLPMQVEMFVLSNAARIYHNPTDSRGLLDTPPTHTHAHTHTRTHARTCTDTHTSLGQSHLSLCSIL